MREKFIPKVPDKSVISVRLADELIEQIDDLSRSRKMSRNELIKQCIVFALAHIDEDAEAE